MEAVSSFKLHKKGKGGIEIAGEMLTTPRKKDREDGKVYRDHTDILRKDGAPKHIIDAIDRLKYFLLSLCGYWLEAFDPYMDWDTYTPLPADENAKAPRRFLQTLWERCYVSQGKIDSNSITLMGVMEVVENKPLPLNPQKITVNDEVEYYGDARQVLEGVFVLLVDYFSTIPIESLEDYRKYLLDHADESRKQEIAKYDEQQIMNVVMSEFQRVGMLTRIKDSATPALDKAETADDAAPAESFEEEPAEEVVEESPQMDAGETWTAPKEKADIGQGTMVPEDGAAEPVPAEAAYSENMGDQDVVDPGAVDTPPEELDDEDFV